MKRERSFRPGLQTSHLDVAAGGTPLNLRRRGVCSGVL